MLRKLRYALPMCAALVAISGWGEEAQDERVNLATTAVEAGHERAATASSRRAEAAATAVRNTTVERQRFGPLLASGEITQNGARYTALRPLWLHRQEHDAAGQRVLNEHTFLYPLFNYRREAGKLDWSLFNLVNYSRSPAIHGDAAASPARGGMPVPAPSARGFDLWPLYFSHDTGEATTSYRALFPIAGEVKQRFGYESLRWYGFPLSLRSEKAGRITHSILWPIFKKRSGDGHRGVSVWPLFGWAEKPDLYRDQFFLWPLIHNNARYDSRSGARTQRSLAVLPFYAREERPGSLSETYLWPFFGYTRQDAHGERPAYRESRYLWPLFVQGRGAAQYVNRWAPFYTHSIRSGSDKRWLLWPLLRHEEWTDAGVAHTKNQLLFFLYASEQQRSATVPELPAAHKTHLWPLLSSWDNGAGRSQMQLLSPLSVFFPHNEKIRLIYNPLFALYRHDRDEAQALRRHELFWRAIVWERHGEVRELRLFGRALGLRKSAETQQHWRPFLFDFAHKADTPRTIPATTATAHTGHRAGGHLAAAAMKVAPGASR